MRKLYRVNVMKMGRSYSFNYSGKVKVYRGSEEGLKTLLRKLKVSDTKEEPRSFRIKTFGQIAQEIIDQSDSIIYIWSNILDKMQMIVTEAQELNIQLGTVSIFDYEVRAEVLINGKSCNIVNLDKIFSFIILINHPNQMEN